MVRGALDFSGVAGRTKSRSKYGGESCQLPISRSSANELAKKPKKA